MVSIHKTISFYLKIKLVYNFESSITGLFKLGKRKRGLSSEIFYGFLIAA
jgi:hypothetical protein